MKSRLQSKMLYKIHFPERERHGTHTDPSTVKFGSTQSLRPKRGLELDSNVRGGINWGCQKGPDHLELFRQLSSSESYCVSPYLF